MIIINVHRIYIKSHKDIIAQHSLTACPATPPTWYRTLPRYTIIPASMLSAVGACCNGGDRAAYPRACGYFFSYSEAFSAIMTSKFQFFLEWRISATTIKVLLYTRSPAPPPRSPLSRFCHAQLTARRRPRPFVESAT